AEEAAGGAHQHPAGGDGRGRSSRDPALLRARGGDGRQPPLRPGQAGGPAGGPGEGEPAGQAAAAG
ncbi:unnamed protein product, partial [Heterosigma akashiwo]